MQASVHSNCTICTFSDKVHIILIYAVCIYVLIVLCALFMEISFFFTLEIQTTRGWQRKSENLNHRLPRILQEKD